LIPLAISLATNLGFLIPVGHGPRGYQICAASTSPGPGICVSCWAHTERQVGAHPAAPAGRVRAMRIMPCAGSGALPWSFAVI
jgi:hypothetical protein